MNRKELTYTFTETWATYSNEFYAGKPSVIHRKINKGTVTYIGIDTEDARFIKY